MTEHVANRPAGAERRRHPALRGQRLQICDERLALHAFQHAPGGGSVDHQQLRELVLAETALRIIDEDHEHVELRSGREGHPSYRAVAHEMHTQIAAVHPAVAAAMTHVDHETEPRLERILSEMRSHSRATAR